VTVISPLLVGCIWKGITTINPSNAATLLYKDTCRVSLNRGLAILVNHPRELVISSKSVKTENKTEGEGMPTEGHSPMQQETLQCAVSSGIINAVS
jgi:hypothetical protein